MKKIIHQIEQNIDTNLYIQKYVRLGRQVMEVLIKHVCSNHVLVMYVILNIKVSMSISYKKSKQTYVGLANISL
jgi:hypothetical protein